jgi:NDP-sugar pyrophosphorylase family protein
VEKSILEMEFLDSQGKKFKITIDEPREDLTEMEIRAAMDEIVQKNVFFTSTGDIVAVSGARYVRTSVEELNI